jgi:hypothetical protein
MGHRADVWIFVSNSTDVFRILRTCGMENCARGRIGSVGVGSSVYVPTVEGMVRFEPLRLTFSKLDVFTLSLMRYPSLRPWARKIGQLWYEIFDFSCNRSPEQIAAVLEYSDTHQLIMCMHPHGIVPFHAWLWAAYADQYLCDKVTGRALYGFGAAADAVGYVPGLRNIMGWLSAGSATYKVLKDGITKVRLKL